MPHDLFHETPTITSRAKFADFWQCIPTGAKSGKVAAEHAWRKLSPALRVSASERVRGYYEWWRKTNKDASWLHPSTYLTQRRWEDEAWQPEVTPDVDRAAFWAESIKSARYVSPSTCPPALCREMIERGLVTARQVTERGLAA